MKETLTTTATPEIERALCGCLLFELDANGEGVENLVDADAENGLTAESFTDCAAREVYAAIRSMADKGIAYTIPALTDAMRKSGALDKIGGVAIIEEMIDNATGAADEAYYRRLVIDAHNRRKTVSYANALIASAQNPNASLEFSIGKAETELNTITNRNTEKKFYEVTDEVTECYINEIRNPSGFYGLSTGYRGLDHFTKGMKPGQLVVIAARPGIGKTSLAMNIAECVALGHNIDYSTMTNAPKVNPDTGKKPAVLYFSLEMGREELVDRMIKGLSGVVKPKLKQPSVSENRMVEQVTRAGAELRNAPLEIVARGGLDIIDIMRIARRVKRARGLSLIVVDYLQLAKAEKFSKQTKAIEVGAITGGLKTLAIECGVPVIALSQFSREAEKNANEPALFHLRDSGSIEQDCDIAILLSRAKFTQTDHTALITKAEIAKNRSGNTGRAWLRFNGELTRYFDTSKEERQKADELDGKK